LEKVKKYGSRRKMPVTQQTNYFNKRYSVSLIGFSWNIGLKCADKGSIWKKGTWIFKLCIVQLGFNSVQQTFIEHLLWN
jgi:hypothetical protein